MSIPVTFSGGSGTLPRSVSRNNQPKQVLPLVGDSSLFQQTTTRAQARPGAGSPIIVCGHDHRFLATRQLQVLSATNAFRA